MPYVKNRINVKVPHRSGFDKSHRNSGTLTCGTITPILCDEVVPGSRVSLKLNLATQLPPLVSDTYMNLKLRAEAFFVPSRLCCASFEDFFCDFPKRVFLTGNQNSPQSSGFFEDVNGAVPVISLYSSLSSSLYGPGSLLDYLGFKIDTFRESMPGVETLAFSICPLPLIAYHLVWQEWYRNPKVQNPAFAPSLGLTSFSVSSQSSDYVANLPYTYYHFGSSAGPDNHILECKNSTLGNFNCADGISFFSLRQRNFGLDFYTGARPDAQQGSPSTFDVHVDSSGDGTVSIAQVRAANSLQQFRERNNIPSPRLVDQVAARYGASLADGIAQRPICIGAASYDVDSVGISQTAPSITGSSSDVTSNLFETVGSQYGRAYGSGSDFIIDDFTANEPGYILVNITLVPEVTYSSGVSAIFSRYRSEGSITDMACSLLQNVGDQPIFANALANTNFIGTVPVFGYQDRYADWMFCPNEAHGQFRDGQSLQHYVLQRSFGTSVGLYSSFLEIPKDYLDHVYTTAIQYSKFSAWYDSMLEYKVSMPLAEFSIPSLQDPAYEHGKSVSLRRNGQIF